MSRADNDCTFDALWLSNADGPYVRMEALAAGSDAVNYARMLSWALSHLPAFASGELERNASTFAKKRGLCMIANVRRLAELIEVHAHRDEIVVLAATEANFARLFDTLLNITVVPDEKVQSASYRAVSATLMLFNVYRFGRVHGANGALR